MSIANKLIYLNTTKEKLKDSINNIGGSITDETTFRAYATELDNIYSSLPKTTGEGSNLSLSTLKGRINVDDIKGDTSQFTTTGKNLLKLAFSNDSTNVAGLTFSHTDSTFTLSGTTTGTYKIFTLSNIPSVTSGQAYTLSVAITGTNPSSIIGLYFYDSSNNLLFRTRCASSNSYTETTTPTFSATIDHCTFVIEGLTNNTSYNLSAKIMFEKGSSKTTFEPYTNGASPNPTYPQDIEVVTGSQEVRINGTNIYDSSYRTPDNTILCAGGTCTEENGVFTIQATRNDMYVWNVQTNGATYSAYQNQLIDFIENTYTVTITNSLFTKNFITFYDKDKKVLNFKQFNANSFTFTKGQDNSVPSEAKYFSLRFGINDSVSGTTYTTSVQIEVGSNATPYTPHQEQTKTLHLGDIELAKIGTYQDRIYKNNDKWYIEKNIGKVVLNGSENWVLNSSGSNFYRYTLAISDIISVTNQDTNKLALSNYFAPESAVQIIARQDNNEIAIISSNRIAIQTLDSNLFTLATFKTWLGTHNTNAYYVLSTPTYTEITNTTLLNELNELEKMMSYNGQTNISVTGSLPMLLSVSALKGE